MKLLFDENLSPRLVEHLESSGCRSATRAGRNSRPSRLKPRPN
ncbi:MAG: DUF5615 family PIN-like protein [Gammaproteobacteria bacterium]